MTHYCPTLGTHSVQQEHYLRVLASALIVTAILVIGVFLFRESPERRSGFANMPAVSYERPLKQQQRSRTVKATPRMDARKAKALSVVVLMTALASGRGDAS